MALTRAFLFFFNIHQLKPNTAHSLYCLLLCAMSMTPWLISAVVQRTESNVPKTSLVSFYSLAEKPGMQKSALLHFSFDLAAVRHTSVFFQIKFFASCFNAKIAVALTNPPEVLKNVGEERGV